MTAPHITASKQQQLAKEMARLGIGEGDLVEKFILGSGKGGQKLNKTSSCVYLKHKDSGIEVKCQRSRSRDVNRHMARRDLCEKIASKILGEQTCREAEAAKIRRQKRRRSRRQKERMLAEKRKQGEKKVLRRRICEADDD